MSRLNDYEKKASRLYATDIGSSISPGEYYTPQPIRTKVQRSRMIEAFIADADIDEEPRMPRTPEVQALIGDCSDEEFARLLPLHYYDACRKAKQ